MHGAEEKCTEIWSENLYTSGHVEDRGTDGRIMDTVLENQIDGCEVHSYGLVDTLVVSPCGHKPYGHRSDK
jgi:hypothetical protein